MVSKKILCISLCIVVLTSVCLGQSPFKDEPSQTTSKFLRQPSNNLGFTGLLDPSRITMSHQMGMSYASAAGSGFTQGYYLNTLSYRFNAPLRLNVRLGVTNNPFLQSAGPGSNPYGPSLGEAEFFGGADLEWQPKDNIFVRFSFDRVPPGFYYRDGYSPFSRNPYSAMNYPSATDDPFGYDYRR